MTLNSFIVVQDMMVTEASGLFRSYSGDRWAMTPLAKKAVFTIGKKLFWTSLCVSTVARENLACPLRNLKSIGHLLTATDLHFLAYG